MDLLEQCAKFLERAERYEVMGEVFKLAIPIYEQQRDFRVRHCSPLHALLSKLLLLFALDCDGRNMLCILLNEPLNRRQANLQHRPQCKHKHPPVFTLKTVTGKAQACGKGKRLSSCVASENGLENQVFK